MNEITSQQDRLRVRIPRGKSITHMWCCILASSLANCAFIRASALTASANSLAISALVCFWRDFWCFSYSSFNCSSYLAYLAC